MALQGFTLLLIDSQINIKYHYNIAYVIVYMWTHIICSSTCSIVIYSSCVTIVKILNWSREFVIQTLLEYEIIMALSTVYVESFAGLNFHGFRGFLEERESFLHESFAVYT